MKCSHCSNDLRPIVVSDIDGTLANYHAHYTYFACQYFDIEMPKTDWDGRGEFEDHLGLTKEQYREAKLAYRQGGNKRLLVPYPRALDFMEEMHNAGAEIWVCTTRPYQRLDNVDPDTREWLRRYSIHFDGLLYGEDKYERLVSVIDRDRVVAVVDDLSSMILRAQAVGLPTFQVHRPHNTYDIDGSSGRVGPGGSLVAATTFGRMSIERWKQEHQ